MELERALKILEKNNPEYTKHPHCMCGDCPSCAFQVVKQTLWEREMNLEAAQHGVPVDAKTWSRLKSLNT